MKDMIQMTTSEFVAYVEAERKAAVLAEREACAKVCDARENKARKAYPEYYAESDLAEANCAARCAAAIRARGEK